MKAQVKDQLSLTKKEWNGMIVLIVLIILVLAAPYAYQWFHKDSTINPNEFKAALAALENSNANNFDATKTTYSAGTLFKFNPNHLSAEKWRALGLSEKQVNTITNYEAKGGRFYKTEDFKTIYGLSDSDFKRLSPYIDLPSYKSARVKVLELNSADSAHLTSVSGIGPAFARRIVYYRERLGGFVDKDQLKEVTGIDDLKYMEIKDQLTVNAARIRKININTIAFDKLRLMPYLNYKQVNAIIEYRNQHGAYASINDLKDIPILTEEILRKIEPYLSY
ncbi:hypothetical protein DYU05_15645 [Mucilaginibacter terrenus]|uniref:Helix-hairpin-helix domain-containing protein n=1 Tax=Mucilaginibacter terrenus TaxID=2482727 RepID=A0A3E2NM73_9SPHI|nr:helix-hairpin-helix domain-containing protein [Mucilaginibacter terrenus]RFZ82062.1 hypothetical protein DYU05_15645 [Mucilaginibacter terrenus]